MWKAISKMPCLFNLSSCTLEAASRFSMLQLKECAVLKHCNDISRENMSQRIDNFLLLQSSYHNGHCTVDQLYFLVRFSAHRVVLIAQTYVINRQYQDLRWFINHVPLKSSIHSKYTSVTSKNIMSDDK